ncbi:hypothetical protein UPYG_G00177450 [Umbra pygmaea]|uniref:Uncharacterized protein n=1 Tax=Umbra pygmaea TaxID=75934 RepID=A0ABD0XF70_UMBPY
MRKADEAYEKDGSLLTVTPAMKGNILDRLGTAMYEFSAYPTQKQIEDVAKSLVVKHPCLKEPGVTNKWYCWKFSLSFKMGNLRQKYRIAGCPELTVNRMKCRSAEGGKGTRKMKKAKRFEINFLPDIPEGKTPCILENERTYLIQEMKKKKPDWKMIDSLMGSTFAMRRKEIVDEEPPLTEVADRWPALFSERQITSEFMRLVSADLLKVFFDGLDKYVPKLIELYRVRDRSITELHNLLHSLDVETSNQKRRAVALLGLPYYLKEDPSKFINICQSANSEEVAKRVDVGLLIITEEEESEQDPLSKDIVDVGVILEEHIVLHNLADIAIAFAMLMGLLYSLNIDYPKGLKYTFEMIQKVVMDVGGGTCSARIHGLRNKMLLHKV